MQGDDKVRFCDQCQLNVYNLSAMGRDEAEEYARRHEKERVCLMFYRRADGTVLTQDCPRGLAAARATARKSLKRLVLLACVLLFLGFGGGLVSMQSDKNEDRFTPLWQIEPFRSIHDWLYPPPVDVTGW
jgi:hypothetical protein